MPETQLSKFRQQNPEFEGLSDAAILTQVHQKHYNHVPYSDFVNRFESKYGGAPERSFGQIAEEKTIGKVRRYAVDSPVAAGADLLGNIFDFFGQTVPTAAVPRGEESFLSRLEREQQPSELVPDFGTIPTPVGPVTTEMARTITDIGANIFNVLPTAAIRNFLRRTATKHSPEVVRKLLTQFSSAHRPIYAGATTVLPKSRRLARGGAHQLTEPNPAFYPGGSTIIPKSRRLTGGTEEAPLNTFYEYGEGIRESIKKMSKVDVQQLRLQKKLMSKAFK